MSQGTCAVEGCDSGGRLTRGWCQHHYKTWLAKGDATWRPATAADRFWRLVDRSGSCWLWTGRRNWAGYGQFDVGDRSVRSHRFAWESVNGPIPEGMVVRHVVCDNPPCVNPAHLVLGTMRENMADRDSKGRNGRAKLDSNTGAIIRARVAAGEHQETVAAAFGITRSTVSRIVRGEVWA